MIILRLGQFKSETRRKSRRGFLDDFALIRTTARLERLSEWHFREQGNSRGSRGVRRPGVEVVRAASMDDRADKFRQADIEVG